MMLLRSNQIFRSLYNKLHLYSLIWWYYDLAAFIDLKKCLLFFPRANLAHKFVVVIFWRNVCIKCLTHLFYFQALSTSDADITYINFAKNGVTAGLSQVRDETNSISKGLVMTLMVDMVVGDTVRVLFTQCFCMIYVWVIFQLIFRLTSADISWKQ